MTTQPKRSDSQRLPFQGPTLLRDIRFWKVAGQAITVVVVVVFLAILWHNLTTNMQQLGIQLGFDFLNSQASFDIGESFISYSPADSFGRAMLVGLINTLWVTAIGIVLSTIVGLVVGFARLSSNWLVQQLAKVYVEAIRNTPLLLQLFFIYFVGFANFPKLDGKTQASGPIYFTNRGLAVPWLAATPGTGIWLILLAIGILVAALLWRWRTHLRLEQGVFGRQELWASGAIATLSAILAFIFTKTGPFSANIPEVIQGKLEGGLQLTPEFATLTIGLTLFSASFIAEIVRGGIQAVPKGQWEAARALGLKPPIITQRVILPQALRVIVPPLTSQYLNLAKNSSLAIAIGYPDIYFVSNTTFNQTGRAVEVMLILATSYLTISLIVSLLMNLYNRTIQIKER